MKLLLIRHAESQNNALMAKGTPELRVPDPHISELGKKQAHALGEWIKSSPRDFPKPDVLYSSLMIRTIETAAPLAEAWDLPIIARTDTFERRGVFSGPMGKPEPHPGSSRSELQAVTKRVELPSQVTEEGWFPGPFETQAQGMRRALRLAHWLRGFPDETTVALVAHGEINAMLLAALTAPKRVEEALEKNTDERNAWREMGMFWAMENTATTFLEIGEGDLILINWMNRTDHLLAAGLQGLGASAADTATIHAFNGSSPS
ncbi:histidine phosphatase family protein [Actinomycetaceae bacterium TAE3-ERU4]|nr:histidine phosphatase family protein [Actinomycetaceae bacterium TAE3-ERU4]